MPEPASPVENEQRRIFFAAQRRDQIVLVFGTVDHRPRLRVADDEGRLAGVGAAVDRHHRQTRHPGTEDRDEQLHPVGLEQRYPLARLQPECPEAGREPAGPLVQVEIGERDVVDHDRLTFTMLYGGSYQQSGKVHVSAPQRVSTELKFRMARS